MKVGNRTSFLTLWLLSDILWHLDTKKSTVALTFDDGPNTVTTEKILDILRRYEIKSTFFVLGSQAVKYPEIIKTIQAEGHAIQNHGFHHNRGAFFTYSDFLDNIQLGIQALDSLGVKSSYFRPPYGSINPYQYFRSKNKIKLCFWTWDSMDYRPYKNPYSKNIDIKNGDIMLFHDNPKHILTTINYLPVVVELALEKNFSFTTLD